MGFKPLGTRGESYASMGFEEMAKYYNRNQDILKCLDQSGTRTDTQTWLEEAAKDGILFYRDGRAVAEDDVKSEIEKIWEGYENRTSDPFLSDPFLSGPFLSDLVIVGYNPFSSGQRFEYYPIVLDDKIRANQGNPLTEEQLDQKYKEAAEPRKEEPRNIPRGGSLFDDDPFAGYDPFGQNPAPAEKEETAPAVEEKKDDFDPDFGPSGFNGKEFTVMTRAEQEAYNKDVAAIMDELSKTHTVNDDKLHEVLLDASKHGMLYYPNGEMVSEQNLETLFETLPYVYDANPDRAANTFSDFIVVEYNPVTEDITDRTFDIDDGSVSMDKAKFLEVEDIYKKEYRYKESLVRREEINARREATIAENAANRVALQQAVEEVNNPVEENAVKLFEFTRPVAVENERNEMREKRFDDMSPDEQRQFFYRNETVLRGLDASENAEDVSLWLNDAANRGILFYRDGSPVPTTAIDNEIQKVWDGRKATGEIPFLSDLVFANYNPDTQALGFHPLYVVDGKINVFSERPLTEVEMQYEYEDYAKALKDQEELKAAEKAAEAERINNLSPKELVEELAENVRTLNSAKSTAITDTLKELGLYHDLSYTTQDGVKHEKGFVNVDGQIYLRGENNPATPDKLTRFVEGVQPPKKPSGFLSGVREWWHNNVSKLRDFAKYEEQTKEYEITKYYTCVKAGLDVKKPASVEQYEREAAVELYLNENFENLTAEWNERTVGSIHGPLNNKNIQAKIREQFKAKLLDDNHLLRDFVRTPEMQKLLSENYGASFKLFGENGRKVPAMSEEAKATLRAAGSEIAHRNQWDILNKFATNKMDKEVYTVMSRVADSYDPAKNDLAFMKDLETVLRKNTPMGDRIRESLLTFSSKQLSDFYSNCSTFHRSDAPFSVEMAAVDAGIVTGDMKNELLNEKCAHWLKPLDELTAFSTEAEKDFFKAFKAAFTKYPHIVNTASHEFGTLDENFIKKMAPAVEQYAQVKGYKGIQDLGELGVLEVIAHNGLLGYFSSREAKKDIKEEINPAFDRKALWTRIDLDNWAKPLEHPEMDEATKTFIEDFKEGLVAHSDIREQVLKDRPEIREMDENARQQLADVAKEYSNFEKGKLGDLAALVVASKIGLLSEKAANLVDFDSRTRDKNYGASKKFSEMSNEERKEQAFKLRADMDSHVAEEHDFSKIFPAEQNAENVPVDQNNLDEVAQGEAQENNPQMGSMG